VERSLKFGGGDANDVVNDGREKSPKKSKVFSSPKHFTQQLCGIKRQKTTVKMGMLYTH